MPTARSSASEREEIEATVGSACRTVRRKQRRGRDGEEESTRGENSGESSVRAHSASQYTSGRDKSGSVAEAPIRQEKKRRALANQARRGVTAYKLSQLLLADVEHEANGNAEAILRVTVFPHADVFELGTNRPFVRGADCEIRAATKAIVKRIGRSADARI
jgi:hypothetical protein